jgi:poly(A) polymerase
MPLITPVYPSMNSAYNVGLPQLRVLKEEFQRAEAISRNLDLRLSDWEDLFEPTDFFDKYQNYVQVEISASNEDDYHLWLGWTESRLRLLILALEQPPMLQCRPHGDLMSPQPNRCSYFMGLIFEPGVNSYDISASVQEFLLKVHTGRRLSCLLECTNVVCSGHSLGQKATRDGDCR